MRFTAVWILGNELSGSGCHSDACYFCQVIKDVKAGFHFWKYGKESFRDQENSRHFADGFSWQRQDHPVAPSADLAELGRHGRFSQ